MARYTNRPSLKKYFMTKEERKQLWKHIHNKHLIGINEMLIDQKYKQCLSRELEISDNLKKYDVKHNLPNGYTRLMFKRLHKIVDFIFCNDEELSMLVELSNSMLNDELIETLN